MSRVSVVCYFHDEAKYLGGMIQSVLDQTFEDFELVLFDNGSTDQGYEIASCFKDPRVRLYRSDVDISLRDDGTHDFAKLNNHVIGLCDGDLIAIIGGDDLMMPDRLEQQVAAFDADPDLDICHSAARHIDANSNLLPTMFTAHPYNGFNLLRIMFSYCEVAFPTAMIKRQTIEDEHGFEGGYCPDYDFWLKTAIRRRYRYLPEFLMYYRVHDKSASHSAAGARECRDATVAVRAKYRQQYSIEDFFPEIDLCQDKRKARAVAHLELGNMMLGGGMADLQLALSEYKLADQFWTEHPAIIHNAAVVMALDGQGEVALNSLEDLPDSPLVNETRLIAKGVLPRNFQLSDGRGIGPELYEIVLPAGTWKSDGTVVDGVLLRQV